ncbi:MAG: type II toxin-antitoxin system VapC family toxin [Candidatus Bathyarchaeota archaeon]|nr:type II toxin-antitoxin system VapC family toxin [Candidatus Bathyarchaeota archaeon]
MVVLDTGVVLDRVKLKKEVPENVTVVSVVEWPPLLKYAKFRGKVYYPRLEDFRVAYETQERLYRVGKMMGFADLLLASICVSRNEKLVSNDSDFKNIAEVSDLNVELI